MECVACYEVVEKSCSTCVHPCHSKCATKYLELNPDWNKKCFVCGCGDCVFDAPALRANPIIGNLPAELAAIPGLKTCPGCGTAVEKNGGCDFVRCRCGVGFRFSNRQLYNFATDDELIVILFAVCVLVFVILMCIAGVRLNNGLVGSCVSQQPAVGQLCTAEEVQLRLEYLQQQVECERLQSSSTHFEVWTGYERFATHFPALRDMYLDKAEKLFKAKNECIKKLEHIDDSWSLGRVVISCYRVLRIPIYGYLALARWLTEILMWLCRSALAFVVGTELAQCATQRIFIALPLSCLNALRLYAVRRRLWLVWLNW